MQFWFRLAILSGALLSGVLHSTGWADAIPERELEKIGKRVWQNECAGTRDGLTSWTSGEQFASLGIGHFIWYPKGKNGPFEESFPELVAFFKKRGVTLPKWLTPETDCIWQHRVEFQAAFRSAEMNQLRDLLAGTVSIQSEFLALRMEKALPKLVDATRPSERANVKRQFERLRTSGPGTFALIDYVNFKGEGIAKTERYNGVGWGLLQVLQGMGGDGPGAHEAFAKSAENVLRLRVKNSPPARNEERWLPGWGTRVRSYSKA
jgi:hypothetical protein